MSSHQSERLAVAARARQVRREVYGEQGIPALAEAMGIPPRTWENFEAGVTIPPHVILEFIALTGVNSRWLRTGEGEPYLGRSIDQNVSD